MISCSVIDKMLLEHVVLVSLLSARMSVYIVCLFIYE